MQPRDVGERRPRSSSCSRVPVGDLTPEGLAHVVAGPNSSRPSTTASSIKVPSTGSALTNPMSLPGCCIMDRVFDSIWRTRPGGSLRTPCLPLPGRRTTRSAGSPSTPPGNAPTLVGLPLAAPHAACIEVFGFTAQSPLPLWLPARPSCRRRVRPRRRRGLRRSLPRGSPHRHRWRASR